MQVMSDIKTKNKKEEEVSTEVEKVEAVIEPTPAKQEVAPAPKSPLQELQEKLAAKIDEIGYKMQIIKGLENEDLMIGIEPKVSVDVKIFMKNGKPIAHVYGFIHKDSKEKMEKVLASVGITSFSNTFLHRSGR